MRLLLLVGVLLVASAHASLTPNAPFTSRERAQGYRDHVILAKPLARHRATAAEAETRERVRVRDTYPRFGDLRVIALDSADAADRAIARLRATGRYEFVERDRLHRAAVIPNDPGFSQQWSLNNTGQSGGVAGADIKAPAAWDVIREAPNVIVAVLDSGVNIHHLDIAANIWRNPSPTFGDVNGASFVNGVRTNDPLDVNGHGTHCAGIIGATGNNANAMTGIAWRVQIMPVRVMTADGLIATSDFAAGVEYALRHGAHVINVSLFTDTHSQADLSIIKAAREAGVILVAAAGNENLNIDASPHYYPDAYPVDNIVSVAASTRTETLAPFSNYGASVDLAAPGLSIISLVHSNNTGGISLSGTSMAAPHVAGALALLKARFPTDTHRQLINRLLRGTDVLPAYEGKTQSGGRLNLLKAVTTTDNRPFNDDFAARPRLTGPNLGIRSNNAGAGAESGEPSHAGASPATTLWWQWTAPAAGVVSVDTLGSNYDTVLAVYTGTSLDALTAVAANDDFGSNTASRLTFNAESGGVYQIAVGGKGGASGATFVSLGTTPSNDAFASAATLTGESTHVSARNVLASREPGEPRILDLPGGASVWYRWTAPRNGRFQVSVGTVNYFDPMLAVYTGSSLDALSLVAASDNIGPGNENVAALCAFDAVAGTVYHIVVDAKNPPNTGEFTLSITDALWQAATLRMITGAPAVGADGTLYAGSTDFTFYAFNADGSLKWRYATQDTLDRSTPAVGEDGTIYVYSLDGNLYALRPDGMLRWRRDFGVVASRNARLVCSSPAIGLDGTVYLKAGDGHLHALDPATGATRWRYNVNAAASYASPAIGPNGTIYQGSTDRSVYALDPDGTLRWKFDAGEPIQTTPALDAAGNVYLGLQTSGRLVSLTPSGAMRWSYSGATGGTTSSPALSADGATVYFGARDRRIHSVDTGSGVARWTFTLGGEVGDSSPAVDANGVVYIGCRDRKLYAVHANGTLKRTWDTGGRIESSPAIAGTTLYIGSDDTKLYAFNIGAGPAAGPWPQFHHHARRTSRALADSPVIASVPAAQYLVTGSALTLTVVASGAAPLSYQWLKDGAPIAGATAATYTVASASEGHAGSYTVRVSNAPGTAVSRPITVAVAAAGAVTDPPRLVNLSILTSLSSPNDAMTVGTVIGGTGTSGAKPLLVRAVGPSLTAFNVAAPHADPRLQFYVGQSLVAANDNWLGDGGIASTSARVGAFPLASAASRDAALYRDALGDGEHSIRISGVGGATGEVLAEIYDATPSNAFTNTTPRLVNVSVLKHIGSGLTAGFVIGGSGAAYVLVRAVGPTLGTPPFDVADVIANPQLELFGADSRRIASNDDWGGTAELSAAFARVGAFALPASSRDAALLMLLAPGNYTAQVRGVNNTSGVALVEVYQVP